MFLKQTGTIISAFCKTTVYLRVEFGFYFFFFFAHFVAAHLKECNKTRKGKEGTCLRSMMAKEKWAAGSPGLTQSGHS